jgi:hypothetical protein
LTLDVAGHRILASDVDARSEREAPHVARDGIAAVKVAARVRVAVESAVRAVGTAERGRAAADAAREHAGIADAVATRRSARRWIAHRRDRTVARCTVAGRTVAAACVITDHQAAVVARPVVPLATARIARRRKADPTACGEERHHQRDPHARSVRRAVADSFAVPLKFDEY